MKTRTVYIDEISGGEYNTESAAKRSEKKSDSVRDLFAFVKFEKDSGCRFANGGYCVKRDRGYYARFRTTILRAIRLYERGCYDHFGKELKKFSPWGVLNRWLEGSPIIFYMNIFSNICPKCHREWGQSYYAIHCPCNGKAAPHGL